MAVTQGIKLDESTQKRLKALGEARDRSPHWLMKQAIDRYLAQEEQYELEKREDMERWQRYQLTGEAISNEAATQWLEQLAQGVAAPCPK